MKRILREPLDSGAMSRAVEPPDTGALKAVIESMKLSSEFQWAHTSVIAIWVFLETHFCKTASPKSTTQPKPRHLANGSVRPQHVRDIRPRMSDTRTNLAGRKADTRQGLRYRTFDTCRERKTPGPIITHHAKVSSNVTRKPFWTTGKQVGAVQVCSLSIANENDVLTWRLLFTSVQDGSNRRTQQFHIRPS